MQTSLPSSNLRTPPAIIATIIVVSAAASALICYLVYFHAPLDVAGTHLRSLPLLNAVLNGLCTIALLVGFGTFAVGASRSTVQRCLRLSFSRRSFWSPI